MYAFFIAIWLFHHGAYAMQVSYKPQACYEALMIRFDEHGIPKMPSIQSLKTWKRIEPFVNELINYKAVYRAYLAHGYSNDYAKNAIKEYLEDLASRQINYKKLKNELIRFEKLLHQTESNEEFDKKLNSTVEYLKSELESKNKDRAILMDKLAKAQELLKSAQLINKSLKNKIGDHRDIRQSLNNEIDYRWESNTIAAIEIAKGRDKIFILQLCLGAGVGGIFGMYVHKAALLIAYKIDELEECDIEEKRNGIIKLLTDDTFKPLLLLFIGLGAYGSILV